MRKVFVIGTAALWLAVSTACSSGPPASGERWLPQPVPDAPPSLVEVSPLREEPVLGVHVAPGRILVMAPRAWDEPALVRGVASGVTGSVVDVVDWWSGQRVEWALLEVQWNGEAPAVATLADGKPGAGESLSIVSVRNNDITQLEATVIDAQCTGWCWLHAASDDPLVGLMRSGAPVFDDRGHVVALYATFGIGKLPRDDTPTEVINLVSAAEWARWSPRQDADLDRFAEALLMEAPTAKAVVAAQMAYSRGDFSEAIDRCVPLVEADPANGVAVQILGSSYYRTGAYADAETVLRAAVDRTSSPLPAMAMLAYCAGQLGRAEEAALFAGDVADDPSADVQSLRIAAAALMGIKRYGEAADAARRVLQLDPGDERTQRLLEAAEAAEESLFRPIELQFRR